MGNEILGRIAEKEGAADPAGGNFLDRRPGPKIDISDDDLATLIKPALDNTSPVRAAARVRARLRHEHQVRVGNKRVLRLMRLHGLLAAQRVTGR
jgi:hypothetical protein